LLGFSNVPFFCVSPCTKIGIVRQVDYLKRNYQYARSAEQVMWEVNLAAGRYALCTNTAADEPNDAIH